MQCLEVSVAVRPIYGSLGVKRLIISEITPRSRNRNQHSLFSQKKGM